MATIGMQGDVSNSVFLTGAYPIGRAFGMTQPPGTGFDTRNNFAGELGALNMDYQGLSSTNLGLASTRGTVMGSPASGGVASSTNKQPATWWIVFAIVFVVVAWAAHRYAPDGEHFAIVKPNLINGVFLTLWIVLILVFLKQIAIRVQKIPGVSALATMVLSA